MKGNLTFDQVKLAGKVAYWKDDEEMLMLEYDPSAGAVWQMKRSVGHEHSGHYGSRTLHQGERPTTGWYID